MAHRVLKTIGAAWLGVALTACGTVDSTGDETKAPEAKSGGDIQGSLGKLPGAGVAGVHSDGIPFTVVGELGKVERTLSALSVGHAAFAAAPALSGIAPIFRLSADDMFLNKARTDAQGNQHLRYRQTKNGLEVVNGELVLHVRPDGQVYAANSSARDGQDLPAVPRVDGSAAARAAARATAGTGISTEGEPRLVYVRDVNEQLFLAWQVRVVGTQVEGIPLVDDVFVDARGQAGVVARHPRIHSALNRRVYSANNGSTTPGTLKRSEGQAAIGDAHVDMNYDQLGYTYNCYQTLFGRDSINNAGATLISTVHYGSNYVNAYWDGTQMVYGDGDGVNSIELGKDADVTVHELTHAVTENESNLTYSGQSGGLNEAMSDTFSAICESWASGSWATTPAIWMIGEDVWTPGTANDALRYMDDPKKDGASLDFASDFTSSTDVHYSSGIPNLAFALLSKGGTHPRGRSTISVPAIGVEKAARIWYKANTDIYTASTTFVQAKTWTIQAALDLGYDQATQDAVKAAWEAVGVGVTLPPQPSVVLTNGIPVNNLGGATGNQKFFNLTVPAGATNLKFTLAGGTGDADLFVRFGSQPSSSTYDCKSESSSNTETCTITTAQAGVYHVLISAYATYSGATLTGSFTTGGPPPNVLQNNVPVTGLAGAASSSVNYTMDVPANTRVTFTTTGGTGDADLYVRFNAAPTTTTYNCRPYLSGNVETCALTNTTAGKYYVMVRGYSAYTGVTLKGAY
ncbi:M4 family metallopeptidase [Myxococcus sp. CA051A]|uniref:M4 family metallopeptidase n=1 Tax=unclassified Myxococcus TaxID=2648731 RepID=UPI00157B53EA|nr:MULTISPECIES: M4 family metallopeptidase [unclassified Myxococcus]NTX10939.1 M4 family metallopeptidase [Myxococcus sp. CA056]NTX37171.1 M4 family metallopeptidase [Myxococcus sp. CA033]NTX52105.1 M4 family metallopeptidase [Myxococcus sp. CA039A]NTX60215.1 M4 family metallopeptidase [Myxococcus sp. CA051A]